MKRWLSCGQYTACIEGCDRIFNNVKLQWSLASKAKKADVVLHIEEVLSECRTEPTIGWEHQIGKVSSLSVYCQNGKAMVGLEQRAPDSVTVYIRKSTNWIIRIGIQYGLMFALYRHCIGLHGVTILCENEIIILSAPSGTGKTTLAKLLEKYCDAIVINGDFALLSLTGNSMIFEPTPFCGTSGRALDHRFRVNRVVFLGQAKENHWRKLDGREAITRFMSNVFVPEWDQEMTKAVQENILKCIDAVKVNAYDFAPTQEAAEMFLNELSAES